MDSRAGASSFRLGMAFGALVSTTIWATAFGGADSGLLLAILRTPGFDKVGHIVIYGSLTALAIRGFGDRWIGRFVPLWPTLFLLVSTADELRQRTVPGRDFSREDMIANVVGVSLGWVVGRLFTRHESVEPAEVRAG